MIFFLVVHFYILLRVSGIFGSVGGSTSLRPLCSILMETMRWNQDLEVKGTRIWRRTVLRPSWSSAAARNGSVHANQSMLGFAGAIKTWMKKPRVVYLYTHCVLCCMRTVGQTFMLFPLSRRRRRRWWLRCSEQEPTLTKGWCHAGFLTELSPGPKTQKSSDKWWVISTLLYGAEPGWSFSKSHLCLLPSSGDWWNLQ